MSEDADTICIVCQPLKQLVGMTDKTRGLGSTSRVTGMGVEEEVEEAYEVVKCIDVSDVNVGECCSVLS